ncbi:hypothetical protein B0H11DRAFT_1945147 [Mycena galericulata]|nr:hypothetical protein B0H11DRAFT_1945147 [Mycena galericulata]
MACAAGSRSPEDELRHLSRAAKLRYLSRLITYRKYRETKSAPKGASGWRRCGETWQRISDSATAKRKPDTENGAPPTRADKVTNVPEHRARRAAAKKNTVAGKETKLRPKTRQYRSADKLNSSGDE